MRLRASQPPFHAPYRSMAVMAYSLQVGMNRQQGLVSGEMYRL